MNLLTKGSLLTCRSASSADPQEAGNLIAQQLLLENRFLTTQLETSERENFDISEYLRHELSVKEQRLTALHDKLDEVRGHPACINALKSITPLGPDLQVAACVAQISNKVLGYHLAKATEPHGWRSWMGSRAAGSKHIHQEREDCAAEAHSSLL